MNPPFVRHESLDRRTKARAIRQSGLSAQADLSAHFVALALRRARGTPLGALLPDEPALHSLAQRLRVATAKIAEIEGLLQRPEFSEPATVARLEELRRRDATESALAAAGIRLQNIRRLRAMRDRFARELDEVGELLEQLSTQAEVVRLAGAADASSAELVREIVSRVEGLDQMLDDDPHHYVEVGVERGDELVGFEPEGFFPGEGAGRGAGAGGGGQHPGRGTGRSAV